MAASVVNKKIEYCKSLKNSLINFWLTCWKSMGVAASLHIAVQARNQYLLEQRSFRGIRALW